MFVTELYFVAWEGSSIAHIVLLKVPFSVVGVPTERINANVKNSTRWNWIDGDDGRGAMR